MMATSVISGSGLFVPEEVITNDELVKAYNQYVDQYNSKHHVEISYGQLEALPYSSSEFIEKASGIQSRHVMYKEGILDPTRLRPHIPKKHFSESPDMVYMAVEAAKEALAQAHCTAQDIDSVISACSNTQRPYPSIAVEVQSKLGINGYSYDMNVACSSATFGIVNAMHAVQSGAARRVLVVNPELASPQVNFKNRDSHFIFGDVCTAVIVEAEETCDRKHAFRITGAKQATQFSNNIRCNANYTDHCAEELPEDNNYFQQAGRKVFKELLPLVNKVIEEHLEEMQIVPRELKRLWLHQANSTMNHFAAKKVLGQEPTPEQLPLVLKQFANTASAGSIIAYHLHNNDFKRGDRGLLCSFGAGYSVGSIGLQKL